jgi:hypothetical protein
MRFITRWSFGTGLCEQTITVPSCRRSPPISNGWLPTRYEPRLIESAPVDALHWNGIQIDPFQASHVDAPSAERRHALSDFLGRPVTRPPEWKDAANGAEVVLSGSRMPLVQREVLER